MAIIIFTDNKIVGNASFVDLSNEVTLQEQGASAEGTSFSSAVATDSDST